LKCKIEITRGQEDLTTFLCPIGIKDKKKKINKVMSKIETIIVRKTAPRSEAISFLDNQAIPRISLPATNPYP
jgi:hypothetical protein